MMKIWQGLPVAEPWLCSIQNPLDISILFLKNFCRTLGHCGEVWKIFWVAHPVLPWMNFAATWGPLPLFELWNDRRRECTKISNQWFLGRQMHPLHMWARSYEPTCLSTFCQSLLPWSLLLISSNIWTNLCIYQILQCVWLLDLVWNLSLFEYVSNIFEHMTWLPTVLTCRIIWYRFVCSL